ncbi:MAG TPA: hypothetical protein VIC85_20320 [Ktedonobacterales bacterium]|jgi:hypothetical protein
MEIGAFLFASAQTGQQNVITAPLSFVIYVILCPIIYLTILGACLQLAWPGGTKLRGVAKLPAVFRQPLAPRMSDDPTFRLLCAIGGLISLAVWSAVITNWLANQKIGFPKPSLYQPQSDDTKRFIAILIVGLIAGGAWILAMRFARRPQMALVVIAVSMSVAGTLLFYYALESQMRDGLLVLSLGIFLGELITVAMKPSGLGEGLFAELLLAPGTADDEVVEEDAGEPDPEDDPWRPRSRVWQGTPADASAGPEPDVARHGAAAGGPRGRPTTTLASDPPRESTRPSGPATGPVLAPWTLMRPSAPPARENDDEESDSGTVTPPGGE